MLSEILQWLKNIFKMNSKKTDIEQSKNTKEVADYQNILEINLKEIVANELSNYVCFDSSVEVTGDSERAKYLNETFQREIMDNLKMITSRTLGTGGVIALSDVSNFNGQIQTHILYQTRFIDYKFVGKTLTYAAFLFDIIRRDNKIYVWIQTHNLEANGLYTIENKAMRDGKEINIESIPEWDDISPIVTITGVTQMLFSLIKCPTDDRQENSFLGVSVTYGQDKLINMIIDLFNEIPDEYKNKKSFIGADRILFEKDPVTGKEALPNNGLYKLFRSGGGVDDKAFWEVFSPEIRDTPYFNGITQLLSFFEKSIGVSKGIFTNLETSQATATEIKRAMFSTMNVVDSMRKNLDASFKQIIYSYDVIANAFQLTSMGKYDEVKSKWSWNMLEDSAEQWKHIVDGIAMGAWGAERMREYDLNEDEKTAIANLPQQIDMNPVIGE